MPEPKTQHHEFQEMACELEADEDKARWDKRLKKVAEYKPAPEKPE